MTNPGHSPIRKGVTMKLVFNWPVRTLSGTRDKTTYMNFWDFICIARMWVMPAATPQQATFKDIAQNLASVWHNADALYLDDFKKYARRYKTDRLTQYDFPPRAYGLFIDMMYAWYKSDPLHIDLTTVTVADIVTMDADVRTVGRAVGAEFLPSITLYSDLTHDID
jgi:hypothetical protein